jgi:hypothetical protein
MGVFDNILEPVTEGVREPGSYCFGYQNDIQSWGMHGPHLGMIGHVALEKVAEILRLTPEELLTRINQGQTIEQIALDQGISIEQVIETILTPHTEMITILVQEGYLSQEQADGILEQARFRAEQLVTTQWFGYGYRAPDSITIEPDNTYDSTPRRGFNHRGCW